MIKNIQKDTNLAYLIFLIFLIFFSRVVDLFGANQLLNHFHLLFYWAVFFLYFPYFGNNLNKNYKLIFIIILFAFSIFLSAMINNINLINYFIFSTINLELFIIFLTLLFLEIDKKKIETLKKIILAIMLINIAFSYYQFFLLKVENPDFIRGLFIGMGNGAHLNSAISGIYILYLYYDNAFIYKKLKYILIFLLFSLMIMSDSKQVLLIMLVSFSFNLFFEKKNKLKNILFIFLFIIMIYFYLLTLENFFNNLNFNYIINGFTLKFDVFKLIFQEFNSIWDYLFGLGPGQVNSRLAFLIPKYESFANFTSSELTSYIWYKQESEYITNHITGSSLFALSFFVSSLLAETGIIGICLYFSAIYKIINISKFNKFILSIFIMFFLYSLIYNFPEEPAFSSFVAIISALYIKDNKLLS
jgi:hypothetical protein